MAGSDGDELAVRIVALETAQQRRRIDDRLDRAVVFGEIERREQLRFWLGQIGRRAVRADQKTVGDAAVAQRRQHLARIGRTRRAQQDQRL